MAITPAPGFVSLSAAIIIGAAGGYICSLMVGLQERFGYDDSLDVVGIHMVGGVIGGVLTGVFSSVAYGEFGGLIYGGIGFFVKQVVGMLAVIVFTYVATWILSKILDRTIGPRAARQDEIIGLDIAAWRGRLLDSLGSEISTTPMPLIENDGVTSKVARRSRGEPGAREPQGEFDDCYRQPAR